MPTHTTLPPFSFASSRTHCFSRYCCGSATTTQIVTLLVPLLCEDINCVGRRKTYPFFIFLRYPFSHFGDEKKIVVFACAKDASLINSYGLLFVLFF